VATRLEAALKASSKAAEAAKVLPPGAAQVQPLMEVFFVLADIRGKLQPAAAAGAAAAGEEGADRYVGWQHYFGGAGRA
jgi:hypothetical protein